MPEAKEPLHLQFGGFARKLYTREYNLAAKVRQAINLKPDGFDFHDILPENDIDLQRLDFEKLNLDLLEISKKLNLEISLGNTTFLLNKEALKSHQDSRFVIVKKIADMKEGNIIGLSLEDFYHLESREQNLEYLGQTLNLLVKDNVILPNYKIRPKNKFTDFDIKYKNVFSFLERLKGQKLSKGQAPRISFPELNKRLSNIGSEDLINILVKLADKNLVQIIQPENRPIDIVLLSAPD
ncbi:MAG: hypothetical protein HRT47_09095 [Candidatus Caenarcaniphilales bacterium]|nr:hypothetical protein [Candidatus Caenarcaniphilales bacterium]